MKFSRSKLDGYRGQVIVLTIIPVGADKEPSVPQRLSYTAWLGVPSPNEQEKNFAPFRAAIRSLHLI
jgi:hypothetical protein